MYDLIKADLISDSVVKRAAVLARFPGQSVWSLQNNEEHKHLISFLTSVDFNFNKLKLLGAVPLTLCGKSLCIFTSY